jgi:hypothetical protein
MKTAVVVALTVLLAACGDDAATPYLEFAGGGFIFNYRTADHYYGFVARRKKALPEGSRIEARFEVPAGEEVVIQDVRSGQLQYMFRTGDLEGIVKNHPYRAVLRLIDGKTGAEIARYERTFRTDVDQTSLPREPLVIGPAYQPNPAAAQ